MRSIFLLLTHLVAVALGFIGGIYALPILTAPPAPEAEELAALAGEVEYTGEFRRDLAGSDLLHWGEGTLSVSPTAITHVGKLSPGPDYKLYLTQQFVENEEQFLRVKDSAVQIGDVKTFDNFALSVPAGVDVGQFTTAVVWCESFSEFISAARYR